MATRTVTALTVLRCATGSPRILPRSLVLEAELRIAQSNDFTSSSKTVQNPASLSSGHRGSAREAPFSELVFWRRTSVCDYTRPVAGQ